MIIWNKVHNEGKVLRDSIPSMRIYHEAKLNVRIGIGVNTNIIGIFKKNNQKA